MSEMHGFQTIAVIGAGTMGAGIAAQIANAGQNVFLLDLPSDDTDDPNTLANAAISRLKTSEPPQLFTKSHAERIIPANIRDDMDKLAQCDWIIEAVVEKIDIKKALYHDLAGIIRPDCVLTSNTSTIPISLLTSDMPEALKRRFAITHYFNPVRYMRLMELVAGESHDESVMVRLKDYNDRVLGKGVVRCKDTPGFLGNRVGVFALQVGLRAAYDNHLDITVADALMGRPMGIPKTGVFGLYDLIGVDLMADVVVSLGSILPRDDAFHHVGEAQNPVSPLIKQMLAKGFKGDKSGGGFYRDNKTMMIDLADGKPLAASDKIPKRVMRALEMLALNQDPLPMMVAPYTADDNALDRQAAQFCRQVLAQIFTYAANLIPEVTTSPQDIDDAMKLGFNWQRGVFEMIDAIGHDQVLEMIASEGLPPPSIIGHGLFYAPSGKTLTVRRFDGGDDKGVMHPVDLPPKVIRFHLLRQCLEPIIRNRAASLYQIGDDLRLIEFHSKANALTDLSMEIVAAAAEDHGRGVIIHNDAQHFSAGVDLTAVLSLINKKNWREIDAFLSRFQNAVISLRSSPVPVVAAPSGLAIGGGFEVVLHADRVVAHGNSVFGLVESSVGLVPSGGGIKEVLRRCQDAPTESDDAAWRAWMQIGYARTAASPEDSAKLHYYLPQRDQMVMNRDRLLSTAMDMIEEMVSDGYTPPLPPNLKLAGATLRDKMSDFIDKGLKDGIFYPHDKTVAMAIADCVVSDKNDGEIIDEKAMLAREREAFLRLARTEETKERIAALMEKGETIRN